MATYKILNQVAPAATTETQLYSVPATVNSAVVSSIIVCNQAGTSATYRIAVLTTSNAATGAVATSSNWIVYGATVPASDSVVIPAGITIQSGGSIRVYSSSSTVSFSAFGSEI